MLAVKPDDGNIDLKVDGLESCCKRVLLWTDQLEKKVARSRPNRSIHSIDWHTMPASNGFVSE